MRGMVRDSLLEMLDRRRFVVFLIVTALWVLGVMLSGAGDIQVRNESMGQGTGIEVLGWLKAFELFLSFFLLLVIIGTADIVPKMLVAGRVEYYLSKPVSRQWLIIHKMFGLWVVYGAVMLVCGGISLAVMAAYGHYAFGVVIVFAEKMLALFVWLSVSICIGILTRSYTLAVITVLCVWLAQFALSFYQASKGLGVARFLGFEFAEGSISRYVLDLLYYVLPKFSNQADVGLLVAIGRPVDTWLPVWSTALFGFALLAVAIWLFRRKDY